MGLREAGKYLKALRKRQEDPFLWPDFLTGLPDKHAVIMKTHEAYSKLGKTAVACVRINNINTYLVKYGTDKHAEIIQWAAAILKTSAEKHKCFVGIFRNRDFIAVGKTKELEKFLAEATRLFGNKAKSFYKAKDVKSGVVLSFVRNGRRVELGLMGLISSTIDVMTDIPREHLIPYLVKSCSGQEED